MARPVPSNEYSWSSCFAEIRVLLDACLHIVESEAILFEQNCICDDLVLFTHRSKNAETSRFHVCGQTNGD